MTQLQALLATIVLELPVALAWFVFARWLPRADWIRGVQTAAGVSLLSHPLAWAASTGWLRSWPMWPRLAAIELAVVAIEAVVLAWALRLAWPRALVIAGTMNAASFGLGLMLARLLG